MARIDIHNIEPGGFGATRRINVHLAKRFDIGLVHASGLHRFVKINWARGWTHRNFAAVVVCTTCAQMRRLDASQCAVRVDFINHLGKDWNVAVIPKTAFDCWRQFRSMRNLTFFRVHNTPSAFRFDATHFGHRRRKLKAHPIAMWHLIEPVRSGDGANLDRFEQDIKARITVHDTALKRALVFADTL